MKYERPRASEGFRAFRCGREPFEGYPDLLTVKDVCRITGLSAQTVRASCSSGQLPAVKIGRSWFVPKSRFARYVGAE